MRGFKLYQAVLGLNAPWTVVKAGLNVIGSRQP